MKTGVLTRADGTTVVAEPAWLAASLWEQTRGLLGRPPLQMGQALIIPTQGVHTWMMAYPIDLVFVDRVWTVLLTQPEWPPWRMGPYRRMARYVIELPPGALSERPCREGEQLVWREAAR